MERSKVLIVDDNESIVKMIKNNLNQYKEIEVLDTCKYDQEELKDIENLKPDIVITDIIRNGTDSGLEIIKRCKSKHNSPKFLVISAYDINYKHTKIIDEFIRKPIIDMEEIYRKIKIIYDEIVYDKKVKNKQYYK